VVAAEDAVEVSDKSLRSLVIKSGSQGLAAKKRRNTTIAPLPAPIATGPSL
jgi:hypothetical protein